MEERLDPQSLSISPAQTEMFEQREFDERETETVVYSGIGVVLEKEGLHQRDVPADDIPLFGQQALASELAGSICRVADQLDADDAFKVAVDSVDVRDEQGGYSIFSQVSWNVIFHSGGITWNRIAGLFVLAGKLAVKVLRLTDHVASLLGLIKSWMCKFIKDYLWRWITDSGGWTGIQENENPQQQQQTISTQRVSFLAVGGAVGLAAGVLLGYWLHS